jgi:hypothetical protein
MKLSKIAVKVPNLQGEGYMGFMQKIVDPLVQRSLSRVLKAQDAQDVTQRTDDIINAKYTNDIEFLKETRKVLRRKLGFVALMGIGALAFAGGVMAATSLVAAIAGTTGFAIPLALAGATAFVAGAGLTLKSNDDRDRLDYARDMVSRTTEGMIRNLMQVFPAETAKASKLAAYLKSTFNPAASNDAATTAPQAAPAPANAQRLTR